MITKSNQIVVEEVTDPNELTRGRSRQQQFERNLAWFRPHAAAIYAAHRGKHICISERELFVAESAPDVLLLARQAHPNDEGRFTLYIPQEAIERINTTQRSLVPLP
jgi:hypothetical protein